jgi:hypothetical protein
VNRYLFLGHLGGEENLIGSPTAHPATRVTRQLRLRLSRHQPEPVACSELPELQLIELEADSVPTSVDSSRAGFRSRAPIVRRPDAGDVEACSYLITACNPQDGYETSFAEWLVAQHYHDLIQAPVFVSCEAFEALSTDPAATFYGGYQLLNLYGLAGSAEDALRVLATDGPWRRNRAKDNGMRSPHVARHYSVIESRLAAAVAAPVS